MNFLAPSHSPHWVGSHTPNPSEKQPKANLDLGLKEAYLKGKKKKKNWGKSYLICPSHAERTKSYNFEILSEKNLNLFQSSKLFRKVLIS